MTRRPNCTSQNSLSSSSAEGISLALVDRWVMVGYRFKEMITVFWDKGYVNGFSFFKAKRLINFCWGHLQQSACLLKSVAVA